MYGGNDDYPDHLQNRTDENGNDLPVGSDLLHGKP